ncbi:Uncharacterised protein [Bifidobacterium adolescentis]|nr:Uncharacterised protein [Bifidobacterium adolescentis]
MAASPVSPWGRGHFFAAALKLVDMVHRRTACPGTVWGTSRASGRAMWVGCEGKRPSEGEIQHGQTKDLGRMRDRGRVGGVVRARLRRVRRGRHAHVERGRRVHPRGPQLHGLQARQLHGRRQGRREREEREREASRPGDRRLDRRRPEDERRQLQRRRGTERRRAAPAFENRHGHAAQGREHPAVHRRDQQGHGRENRPDVQHADPSPDTAGRLLPRRRHGRIPDSRVHHHRRRDQDEQRPDARLHAGQDQRHQGGQDHQTRRRHVVQDRGRDQRRDPRLQGHVHRAEQAVRRHRHPRGPHDRHDLRGRLVQGHGRLHRLDRPVRRRRQGQGHRRGRQDPDRRHRLQGHQPAKPRGYVPGQAGDRHLPGQGRERGPRERRGQHDHRHVELAAEHHPAAGHPAGGQGHRQDLRR